MSLKRVRFLEGNQKISTEEHKYKRTKINLNDDDEMLIDHEGGNEFFPEDADESGPSTFKSKKHTLDSDEEDDIDDNCVKLDMEKVEGQEDATLDYEGRIKIMPFNIKDDLEEGHFNEDGTFIYNKKQNVIKDAWLDNIEWDKVKEDAGKNWEKFGTDNESNTKIDEREKQKIDLMPVYSRLLEILNEKNTIAGTLKKLNSEKGFSAAEERKRRWAAKKAGLNVIEDECSKKVMELTSLADSLVSLGQMEAYQLGPDEIKQLIADLEPKISNSKKAEFDMFAE